MCEPDDSGSVFLNYKNFFSAVLMVLVDADYCFISIDVGANGAPNDCNIFKNVNFCKKENRRKSFKYSGSKPLPNEDNGTPMPFFIVGDEAFTLSHVLRPNPSRNLDVARRIYNYRLNRARRIVECAFGILCNKWGIFHRATDVRPDFCDVIVKNC